MASSNTSAVPNECLCECIVVDSENWVCTVAAPEPAKPKRSAEMQAILKRIPIAINWFRKNPNEHNLGKLNFYSDKDHFELVRAYPGFFGNIKIYKNHISIFSNGYRHAIWGVEIENIRFALIIMCNLSIIYKCIVQFNPETVEQKRTGLEIIFKDFPDYLFFVLYEDISNLTAEHRPIVEVEVPKIEPKIIGTIAATGSSNPVEDDLYC